MKQRMEQLKRKYREISELTRPKCLRECPEPGACCTSDYCAIAQARAEEFGVSLPPQQHATLPFMGPAGCVVPPYLRPLCASHVCEAALMQNPAYAKAYLALREEVLQLEEEVGPSWPIGMERQYRD